METINKKSLLLKMKKKKNLIKWILLIIAGYIIIILSFQLKIKDIECKSLKSQNNILIEKTGEIIKSNGNFGLANSLDDIQKAERFILKLDKYKEKHVISNSEAEYLRLNHGDLKYRKRYGWMSLPLRKFFLGKKQGEFGVSRIFFDKRKNKTIPYIHKSNDILWSFDTELSALMPGFVIDKGYDYFSGYYLKWQYSLKNEKEDKRFTTIYSHLAKASEINIGDEIEQCQPVGIMGATGADCNGVHLDFSIFIEDFLTGEKYYVNFFINSTWGNNVLERID
jgi:hypothetical protein